MIFLWFWPFGTTFLAARPEIAECFIQYLRNWLTDFGFQWRIRTAWLLAFISGVGKKNRVISRVFRSSRSLKLDYTMETVTHSRNVCPARYGEPVNQNFRNFFIRWISISRGTNVHYFSVWDVDILLQHTPYKIIAKWSRVTLFIAFFGFSYQI